MTSIKDVLERFMEKNERNKCRVEKLPRLRNIVLDIMEQGAKQHNVHGIFDVDVTLARQILNDHKTSTGEKFSFTAFLVYVIARGIDQNKFMQGIRVGKKVFIFDDVDVNIIIEREDGRGNVVPTTYIVRAANTKSFKQIHEELRGAQQAKLEGSTVGTSKEARRNSMLARLPKPFRAIIWRYMNSHPEFKKASLGTVNITSVGMFAKEAVGWAIPITPWPITFAIGGFSKILQMVDGKPEEREFLHVTATVNHDIVDGSPATRALRYIGELFASACGLEEIAAECTTS